MKLNKALLLTLTLVLSVLLGACGDDGGDDSIDPADAGGSVDPNFTGLTILPTGDSRVEGARPNFESYRYELWKLLVANEWDFDLVGPLTDEASYPEFMGAAFDTDHAGVGGFTTTDILDSIDEFGSPDVMLLGIGGNDLLGGVTPTQAITNIEQIIDTMQGRNSAITIFLEQIAPGRSDFMTPESIALFNEFNSSVANLAAGGDARVIIVDMTPDWTDEYMADEVHYSEAGAKVVAERYYAAMDAALDRGEDGSVAGQ
ncbi:MAG: GDSL-type esterase/lipase family protein [Myxococcota bacterium]